MTIRAVAVAALLALLPTLAQAAVGNDGFNAGTVETFMRAAPSANAPDRAGLALTAAAVEEFRRLAVTNLPQLRGLLTPAGRANLELLVGERDDGPVAHLWQAFLEGSVVYLGHGGATTRTGFYNPLVDGWLIADWQRTGDRFDLVRLAAMTGERMRGAPGTASALPAWTVASSLDETDSLARMDGAAVRAFAARYVTQAAPPGPIDVREEATDRATIAIRLAVEAQGLGRLASDERYRDLVVRLRTALASGDATSIAALGAPRDPAAAWRLAGLSSALRRGLRPVAVVERQGAVTVAFAAPFTGRWVMLADIAAKPEPHLRSLVFADLMAAEAGAAP